MYKLSILLGIVFIALKLTDHIDWSWWFILMPIYLAWVPEVILVLIQAAVILSIKKKAKKKMDDHIKDFQDKYMK